ncbi:hypothetical protein BCT01_00750 [Vibrio tasmaniensis]|nr:hypothetical protein BCT01_00750 [Vibrio tasmaniensis]PMP10031.1 hypothetical protein BCS92_02340 [Vibrio tasmaniensis]
MKYYLMIDANRFYANAELIYRPDLRGKPIIVLSNGDSSIVALNRQASDLGFKRMSYYSEIKGLAEAKGVNVFSSNYSLYNSVSKAFMSVASEFANEQFIYSIDECWLTIDTLSESEIIEHAKIIRREIWRRTRVPVSIGIAKTMTLSKCASRLAKSNSDGVFLLIGPNRSLVDLSANDVWGIGVRRANQLEHSGVRTALALSKQCPTRIRKEFNIDVEKTVRELNNEPCFSWYESRPDKKQIFSTRTVSPRLAGLINVKRAACELLNLASLKARNQQSKIKTITVHIGTSSDTWKPYFKRNLHHFDYATSDLIILSKVVNFLVDSMYVPGTEISKVGVGFLALESKRNEQLDLFGTEDRDTFMGLFDQINRRFGKNTVFLANTGIDKAKVERQFLSKSPTTRWRDIVVVKA